MFLSVVTERIMDCALPTVLCVALCTYILSTDRCNSGVEDSMRNMSVTESHPLPQPPAPVMPSRMPLARPDAAASFVRPPPPVRGPAAGAVFRPQAPAAPLCYPTAIVSSPPPSSAPTFSTAASEDSDDDTFDASSMLSSVRSLSYVVSMNHMLKL